MQTPTDTDPTENAGILPAPPHPLEIQEAVARSYPNRNHRQIVETRVDQGVSAFLDRLPGCWYFKVHGHALQMRGVPDFIGVYRGRFFAFEDKPPLKGRDMAPLQKLIGAKILRAGGIWGVTRSASAAAALLQPVLDALTGLPSAVPRPTVTGAFNDLTNDSEK